MTNLGVGRSTVAAEKLSAREAKRLQTRERLMGAAIAEFKRSGMADADVGAIVTAAGVAHGTFFFHFPTKEHVLLELEQREEERIAKQFGRFLQIERTTSRRHSKRRCGWWSDLERRLGDRALQRLSWHCTSRRPVRRSRMPGTTPVIVGVAQEIETRPGTRAGWRPTSIP